MGVGGGPRICDVCRNPMILEGGSFNNVYADEAWRHSPTSVSKSWINGGMVALA